MTVTFAVIIPVYNGRKHIAETIESVLQQKHAASEIIVVEDGSPVPSADIVAKYPSVRYLAHENSGVSKSRNYGASLATSNWVCFLDQDDLILSNHLEQAASAIAANSAIDICYGGRLVLANGPDGWATTMAPALPKPAELAASLLHRCPFPPSGICIRKSVFNGSGGFSPRYDLAEDWEMWVRLTAEGSVFHRCDEHTMCYRVHPDSVSHRPLPILAANLRVIREQIFPMLSPWNKYWIGQEIISRQQADAAILLRQIGKPGALPLLLRSIVRFPFGFLRRYKIAGHMLLCVFGLLPDHESDMQEARY